MLAKLMQSSESSLLPPAESNDKAGDFPELVIDDHIAYIPPLTRISTFDFHGMAEDDDHSRWPSR